MRFVCAFSPAFHPATGDYKIKFPRYRGKRRIVSMANHVSSLKRARQTVVKTK